MRKAIPPTVGRVLWYYPANNERVSRLSEQQPMAATIAYVHSEQTVNLRIIDHSGIEFAREVVPLFQADDPRIPQQTGTLAFCTWMPYQVGQAQAQTEHAAAG